MPQLNFLVGMLLLKQILGYLKVGIEKLSKDSRENLLENMILIFIGLMFSCFSIKSSVIVVCVRGNLEPFIPI